MTKRSAGLLPYRMRSGGPEVLLVHMGGPYWAAKDEGAWSIAKGEILEGEEPLAAAEREFREETGFVPPGEGYLELGVRRAGGKLVYVWAFEGEYDPRNLESNSFTMEWPPGSGRMRSFPEADRGAWFGMDEAMAKIAKSQRAFIAELARILASTERGERG
jgi:predicted NUDIX family NTP pyrophosphohydrolase